LGAERKFWQLGEGIFATAAGYAGGHTRNPTYEEVCSGRTGHTEVVLVVFDPNKILYQGLLKTFWENHNPTQGMRQGNDVGTQYRSAIYTFGDAQRKAADASKATYQKALAAKGLGASPQRSQPRPRSILPRTIISNISPRIRPAIAVWAAPGCRARSAPAWPPERPVFPTTGALPSRPQRTQKNALLTIIGCKTRAVSL